MFALPAVRVAVPRQPLFGRRFVGVQIETAIRADSWFYKGETIVQVHQICAAGGAMRDLCAARRKEAGRPNGDKKQNDRRNWDRHAYPKGQLRADDRYRNKRYGKNAGDDASDIQKQSDL